MVSKVSRRNFLKGAAAMTVAAAASTLLAGCSGNGGNDAPDPNTITLGDYKVKVKSAGYAQDGTAPKMNYHIRPVVAISYSGKGSPTFFYKEIFVSAMIGDVKLNLENQTGVYNSIVGSIKECEPSFKTTNTTAIEAYLANKTPLTLKVSFDDREYAVFDIYFNNTVKASKA